MLKGSSVHIFDRPPLCQTLLREGVAACPRPAAGPPPATSLLRARLIIARVDLAVRLYPGVVAAPLLLGTLAGGSGQRLPGRAAARLRLYPCCSARTGATGDARDLAARSHLLIPPTLLSPSPPPPEHTNTGPHEIALFASFKLL